MKFKDILVIIFLSGLLAFAFCHRAGIVGSRDNINASANSESLPVSEADSLQFENWIFTTHPGTGLTVSTITGDVLHHLPEFKSATFEIETQPDTTGHSLGIVFVKSDHGNANPCFRIMHDGLLEIADRQEIL